MALDGIRSLTGGGLPSLARAANADDTAADGLLGIAGGMEPTGVASAILKGITQGVGLTKKQKAQARRDAIAAHQEELARWEEEQLKSRAEIENLLQADQYAKASQGHLAQGLQLADEFGDTTEVDRFVRASPAMLRLMQNQLPDGATYTGVAMHTGADGSKALVPVGQLPDGTAVSGLEPMNVDTLLSSFAPDVLTARAAAKAEALRNELQNRKTSAEIDRINRQDREPAGGSVSAPSASSGGAGTSSPAATPKPKPLSSEAAGKVALVRQGQNNIAETRKLLFPKDGQLDRALVTELAALSAVPFGMAPKGVSANARKLFTAAYNWNNAKLRLESGAAVPEQEVDRATKAYIAGILDDAETASFKLDGPEQYFRDYLDLMGLGEQGSAVAEATSTGEPASPQVDMAKAAEIKAAVKAGKVSREQGLTQLRELGFE